jgi:hypothetical protein
VNSEFKIQNSGLTVPRFQATRIERLDAKHPGLRLQVDLWLEENHAGVLTLEEVCARILEKFGDRVSHQTLSSYKQVRWWPHKQRTEELVRRMEAIRAVLGQDAISDSTQAMILEQVDEALRAGARLDAKYLMKLQLDWAKHAATLERDRLKERQLALAEKRAERVGEVVREAEKAKAEGKPFDPAEALRKISEVIGVGAALEERTEPG